MTIEGEKTTIGGQKIKIDPKISAERSAKFGNYTFPLCLYHSIRCQYDTIVGG